MTAPQIVALSVALCAAFALGAGLMLVCLTVTNVMLTGDPPTDDDGEAWKRGSKPTRRWNP